MEGLFIHPRVSIVIEATSEITLFWQKLSDTMKRKSWEEGYLIVNQLDRFWIEHSMKDMPVQDACADWESLNASELALAIFTQKAGDYLVKMVTKYQLTYGEILSILIDIRQREIKYHIRQERHPDDPDKPGGLA